MREILFALDCGSTNWYIYRATYEKMRQAIQLVHEPLPSPLSSFVEGRLKTVILLNQDGTGLESFGETAYQSPRREYIRDFFKPCIGSHLAQNLLPHQTRYTHDEAMHYTRLLLAAILNQLQTEKWRSAPFEENIRFSFAYPVRWRNMHEGRILEDFKRLVAHCFAEGFDFDDQVNFVSEPEAALLSLQKQQLLPYTEGVTLVIDSGGGTTDLTAGELNHETNKLESIHHYEEPHGGTLYDDQLALYLAEELKLPSFILKSDPTIMHQLRMFGRQLKEDLSRQLLLNPRDKRPTQRPIAVVSQKGRVYRRTVKLDEVVFRNIVRYLSADFESLIDKGLRAMRLQKGDVRQVALIGGGGQLFTIVQHIEDRFGPDKVILPQQPSQAVVYGLALEYGRSFGLDTPWFQKKPKPDQQAASQATLMMKPEEAAAAKAEESQAKEEVAPPVPPPPEEIEPVEIESEKEIEPAQPRVKSLVNGRVYLLDDEVITIGRHRSNTIPLYDGQISRHHTEIRAISGGKHEIVDLNSKNGTFVNDEQLIPYQPRLLQAGDKIKFVRIEFVYLR